jgi:hypothetical protein
MPKGAGDKPASRGIFSTIGTLLLAILLVGFGFWAGRTFETLWPSAAVTSPPPTVAAQATPPSPAATPEPSPSMAVSPEPSPAGSPAAEGAADGPSGPPAAGGARRAARRAPPAPPGGAPPAAVAPPPVDAPPPGRPFVPGTSVVESLKPSTAEVPGFEPSGVGVKRAPEVPGRVDFEVDPRAVKPGDRYAVKVYLVNDGGKPIAIDGLSVAMVADGKRSARAMPPRARSVAPKERALLAELPGVWQDGLATWALEVAVTSKRQDRYSNTLNWK